VRHILARHSTRDSGRGRATLPTRDSDERRFIAQLQEPEDVDAGQEPDDLAAALEGGWLKHGQPPGRAARTWRTVGYQFESPDRPGGLEAFFSGKKRAPDYAGRRPTCGLVRT
jgi:hypothetical protein